MISAGGRHVAFAARPRAAGGRPAATRGTVWLHDRQTGRTVLIGRRSGPRGRRAGGLSSEPSVSAGGTRLALTSTAADLDRRKPGGLTGVFVRDLGTATTRLVSDHARRMAPARRDTPAGRFSARAAATGTSPAPAPHPWLNCRLVR